MQKKKKKYHNNAITIQTFNGRARVSAQCLRCKTNKSQFIKELDRLLLAKELQKPVRTLLGKEELLLKELMIYGMLM